MFSEANSYLPNELLCYHFTEMKTPKSEGILRIYEAIYSLSMKVLPTLESLGIISKIVWVILFLQRFRIIAYLTCISREYQVNEGAIRNILYILLPVSTEDKTPFLYLFLMIASSFSIGFYVYGVYRCYKHLPLKNWQIILISFLSYYLADLMLLPFVNECTRFLLKRIFGYVTHHTVQLLLEMFLVICLLIINFIQYSTTLNSTLLLPDVFATFDSFLFLPFCYIVLSFLQVVSEFMFSIKQICVLLAILYLFTAVYLIYNGLRHVYIHENGNTLICSAGFTFIVSAIHASLKAADIDVDEILLYVMIIVLICAYTIFKAVIKKTYEKRAEKLRQCRMNFEKLHVKNAVELKVYMQSGFNYGVQSAIDGSFLEWGIQFYGVDDLFFIMIRYATIVKKPPYYMSYINNLYQRGKTLAQKYIIYEYISIKNARIVTQTPKELSRLLNETYDYLDRFLKLEHFLAQYLCRKASTNYLLCKTLQQMKTILKSSVDNLSDQYPNCLAVLKLNETYARKIEQDDTAADEYQLAREALKADFINCVSVIGFMAYSVFPVTQKFVFQYNHDVELDSFDESYDSFHDKELKEDEGSDELDDEVAEATNQSRTKTHEDRSKYDPKSTEKISTYEKSKSKTKSNENENSKGQPKQEEHITHTLKKPDANNSPFLTKQKILFDLNGCVFVLLLLSLCISLIGFILTMNNVQEEEKWATNITESFQAYMLACYSLISGSIQIRDDFIEELYFREESSLLSENTYDMSVLRIPSQYSKSDAKREFCLQLVSTQNDVINFENSMSQFLEEVRSYIRAETFSPFLFNNVLRQYFDLVSRTNSISTLFSDALRTMLHYSYEKANRNLYLFMAPYWILLGIMILIYIINEVFTNISLGALHIPDKSRLIISYLKKYYLSYGQMNSIIITCCILTVIFSVVHTLAGSSVLSQNQRSMDSFITTAATDLLAHSYTFHLIAAAELSEHQQSELIDNEEYFNLIKDALNYLTNGTETETALQDRIPQYAFTLFNTMFKRLNENNFIYTLNENVEIRNNYRNMLIPIFLSMTQDAVIEQNASIDNSVSDMLICIVLFGIILYIFNFVTYIIYYNYYSSNNELPSMLGRLSPAQLSEFSIILFHEQNIFHIIDLLKKPAALTTQSGIITHVNSSWLQRIDTDETNIIGTHFSQYPYDFNSTSISPSIFLHSVKYIDEEIQTIQETHELEDTVIRMRSQLCPEACVYAKKGTFENDFVILLSISMKLDFTDYDEENIIDLFRRYIEMSAKEFHYITHCDSLKGNITSFLTIFGFSYIERPEILITQVFTFAFNFMLVLNESKMNMFQGKPMLEITCGDATIEISEDSLGDVKLYGSAAAKLMTLHQYCATNTITMCADTYECMESLDIDVPTVKINQDIYQISFGECLN